VLAQTVNDFEILVVDDGSKDNGKKVVESFSDGRIRYFEKENGGAASARNYGIARATGDYIGFLDADDYWYPHFLEEIEELIASYPEEKVFATAMEVETEKNVFPSRYSIPKFKNSGKYILSYFNASFNASILHSSNTVIKKDVIKEAGLFDTRYKIGEDTDYWIRLGLLYPVIFSGKISARYQHVPASLSRMEDITEKPDFDQYTELEKTNPDLKKFLDLNRFSMAMRAKLKNNRIGFARNFIKMDLKNLNQKQRLLLRLSPKTTKFLYRLRNFTERFGIKLSAFK
jgi:glycosyltransferase involved in cell wall biosynthesis